MTAPRDSGSERDRKLHLQWLLKTILARFVGMQLDGVDAAIVEVQQLVVESLKLERSTLWQFEPGTDELVLTHYWHTPGCPDLPPRMKADQILPWATARMRRGEPFGFTRPDELPPEAATDVQTFRHYGPLSNLTFPLTAHGRVFGALAFATLTTERHWTPDEREELQLVAQVISQALAEQRFAARAEQLRAELTHSSRAASLGELAAALAHELDQPLSAILSNAQSALRFLAQDHLDPVELRATLEDITRDTRRASGLIHNLRAMLSREPVRREPCSLNELVSDVLAFLRGQWLEHKIEVRLSLDPALPPVSLARVEVQQVLVNLLINATQALAACPEEHRRITITTGRERNGLTLRVADEGPGIPEPHLEQVFAPFFTTKSTGLGMGLAISRRLIEDCGGTLAAHPNPPRGAMFLITLPLPGSSHTP